MRYLLITMLSIMGSITLAIAQKSERPPFKTHYIVGANLLVERPFFLGDSFTDNLGKNYPTIVPDFGASFEVRFTRHSGIESGLYYRSIRSRAYSFQQKISQDGPIFFIDVPKKFNRHITIPILYKLYTPTLNVAAGLNYTLLVDQTNGDSNDAYANRPRHNLSILIKVSMDLQVHKRLLVEPFYQFDYELVLSDNKPRYWIGGGIGIKYALFKR